jgi:hypothetical protein
MLLLKLHDREGWVDLGCGQEAALVTQQAEPKPSGSLGPERGLHLDPMPKKILGKLPHGLAALDGGKDGCVERGVQIRDLNLRGGDLGRSLRPVLVVGDGHQARLPFQVATDHLCLESVPPTVDPLPVVIGGCRGDVEVLLAAVEVLNGMEGAVLVAETLECLPHLVLGLLQRHPFTQWMRDDQVDDFVLQRVQAGDQAEFPSEPRSVHAFHVRGHQDSILLEDVISAVERRLGWDDLEDHGPPTNPSRTCFRVSRSSASSR